MSSDEPLNKWSKSWEGQEYRPGNEKELREILRRALNYRGDVTVFLKTGEATVGYVFDCNEDAGEPCIKMYLADQPEPQAISYQNISGVTFSGEDTAFGRSWEDWAQKWKKS